MGTTGMKKNRLLEIFFRAMRGESISVRKLADEYGVSGKSISRDLGEIRNFLSESRELTGSAELKYSPAAKSWYLELDSFLVSKELFSILKVLIGSRAFRKMELLDLTARLKGFTSAHDRAVLDKIIRKEMYHYNEVSHDCESVIEQLWQLAGCIHERREITVHYYKMNRSLVERRLMPLAIMFSEYYFYLIAYRCDEDGRTPLYYRADRIISIVEHRERFTPDQTKDFDEGELRSRIQFMHPGEYRKIRFEYSGRSVQAILDKIPTAKIIEKTGNRSVIEAETFGTGINMFLLSQGKAVKALSPESFVNEMKEEIEAMRRLYP